MKLLVDNVLSPLVVRRLRESGYDAAHVRDNRLQSDDDDVIFDRAAFEDRVLVSADTDLGAILATRGSTTPSVILIRMTAKRRPDVQVTLLLAHLPALESEISAGAVVVFEDSRSRVRRLPIR
jgi:predicted nuclease of predicted toxin-antitoxin system